MKCNKCGSDIDDDSKYCCFCGNKTADLSDNGKSIFDYIMMNYSDKNKKKVIIVSALILVIFILFIFCIYMFFQISMLKTEMSNKDNIIEQIHSENNKKQNKLDDLEKIIKKAEDERAEILSLPKCDDSDITWTVINGYKEIYKNQQIPGTNTFTRYSNIDIKYPTTTSYDEKIPRYECKAKMVFDVTYTTNTSIETKRCQRDATYSVSKSNGKPVVYYNFDKYMYSCVNI